MGKTLDVDTLAFRVDKCLLYLATKVGNKGLRSTRAVGQSIIYGLAIDHGGVD